MCIRDSNSIGLKIDGSKSIGPFKSMVTDAFTQYNSNGIGVSITNEGYAQIVSMFTMNLDVGITCISGGQCDITNSNSSFGNYGLIADGIGPRKYTGIVTSAQIADKDKFVLDLNTPTVNINNFVYDNVSGLATVTTSSAHGFEVGMGVTLSSMTLSCNYGSGTHTFVSAASNAVNVQSGAENGNQKTPSGGSYVPSTGVLTLTFDSAHGMSSSDTITLDNESIVFTCDADDHQTNHPYPRATDPIAGVTTAVTVTSTTQFTLNVGQGYSTEVVRTGAGTTVTNVWYVTKDGKDDNSGRKLGDAKATIAGAVAISTTGDVIRVSAGTYTENNPIVLPPQISIVGDSLREVTVVPQNAGSDLFHVAPGNYITELSYTGTMNAGSAIVAFNPDKVYYNTQSPYIRNCTNFITNSIGMKIDGSKSIGPFKSMVTDSFTQYNANGIGVSITNLSLIHI